jgi:hypothetical protein
MLSIDQDALYIVVVEKIDKWITNTVKIVLSKE